MGKWCFKFLMINEKEFSFFILNIFLIFHLIFEKIFYSNNYIIINLSNNKILNFYYYLKKNFNFLLNITLLDFWCVDYIAYLKRFELNYNFLIYNLNFRFFFKIYLKELENIFSISNIFFSSNWLEREIFDFFGINFMNHFNLRKILNDYGFLGFPLRKDFPLSGYFSLKYKNNLKKIMNEIFSLNQQFRKFFFNIWVYIFMIDTNFI